MNKFAVLRLAVLGVVLLEAIALFQGINGKMMALTFSTIGILVGYAFGMKPPASAAVELAKEILVKKTKSAGLAIALALGLSGCAGAPLVADVCYVHPEYGRICVGWDGKNVKITADTKLPPELEAKLADWVKKVQN